MWFKSYEHFKFSNLPLQAKLMLSKASFIEKGCYVYKQLDNVNMHEYSKSV